jgi:hypothetical protein
MSEILFDARIATGFNNVAGLTLVTSLVGTDSAPFLEPLTVPLYTQGQRRFLASGGVQRVGLATLQWRSYVSLGQYATLRTTYERDVTVRTTTGGTGYANYNAYLWFPEPSELEYAPTADTTLPSAAYLLTWNFSIIGSAS